MPQDLDPRIKRFQAIKAQERIKATQLKAMRDQIRVQQPGASDKVVDQILKAHLKVQQAQMIEIRDTNGKVKKVKVQYA